MKIESQSRKGSHKLDGVAVGRIGTFPTGLSESEAEAEEPANHKDGIEHWFILPLLLATLTMQFSLDRKRRSHKRTRCSASDSVGLIFTR